jgi:hypothetical protein
MQSSHRDMKPADIEDRSIRQPQKSREWDSSRCYRGSRITSTFRSLLLEESATGVAWPPPVQAGLTAPMKEAGAMVNDHHRMQLWAGQSAAMAAAIPAGDLVKQIWKDARALL